MQTFGQEICMELSFCSFASGSGGNCYLIKSRNTAILIDAGISTKKIHNAIEEIGLERQDIQGVFITHEHSDHVKGIPVLTKHNPDWKVFASRGTGRCISEKVFCQDQLCCFDAGDIITVGDMEIRSFSISHDAADPVCYSVRCGESKLTILTDTGFVTAEARAEMTGSDIIVLEANHEVNMLKAGPYPYSLKRRILGDHGHLSNETAGEFLAEIMSEDSRFRKVFLAHLSKENNFPRLARQTVANILEENSFYIGRHLDLEVMSREGVSGIAHI